MGNIVPLWQAGAWLSIMLALLVAIGVGACTDSDVEAKGASDASRVNATDAQDANSFANTRVESAPQVGPLQIFPRRVNFGRLADRRPVIQKIVLRHVTPMDGVSPTIIDHPSSVEVNIVSSHEDDSGIAIWIELRPIGTLERVRGQIAIAYGPLSGHVEMYASAAVEYDSADYKGDSP